MAMRQNIRYNERVKKIVLGVQLWVISKIIKILTNDTKKDKQEIAKDVDWEQQDVQHTGIDVKHCQATGHISLQIQ